MQSIPNPEGSARPTAPAVGWCGCWWWTPTIDSAVQQIRSVAAPRAEAEPPTEASAGWCWGITIG
jgi:hypothetical protein